jgi:hypothetical protein
MKAYRKERLENIICYFAREHHKKTREFPFQTKIYKYLALFEFQILETTGNAPLDLTYQAQDYGPVPTELYYKRREIESHCFEFKELKENQFIVKPKGRPNLDYFSDYEIKLMNDLIFIYAQSWIGTKIFSDVSHERIKAWKIAYNRKRNSIINKADTFRDIFSKLDKDITAPEEHFLISEALKSYVV